MARGVELFFCFLQRAVRVEQSQQFFFRSKSTNVRLLADLTRCACFFGKNGVLAAKHMLLGSRGTTKHPLYVLSLIHISPSPAHGAVGAGEGREERGEGRDKMEGRHRDRRRLGESQERAAAR